jgi:DNA primase
MNNQQLSDFIKDLKSRISIADVVGRIVRLKRVGSSLMGLCPFHNERTPSFSVVESKGIYHCFGCQKSGDIISFVQESQALSFTDAVKFLAFEYSIPIPTDLKTKLKSQDTKTNPNETELLYKINHFVANFYHHQLLDQKTGAHALAYLKQRGVSDESIKNFKIGFALNEKNYLFNFLSSKKAPLDKAQSLGLIRSNYDVFRNRIMFPIVDLRGKILGFGGRTLDPQEKAKYINSQESLIFKKSQNLFGLFQAQKDIRALDFCIVVEGFLDCVILHQYGFTNTVATLGTACTQEHVKLLKKLTKNIVVVFDGDEAGRSAQARAMEVFLNEGLVVKGVDLEQGFDPDEFIQKKGKEAFQELIKNAPYLLEKRIYELVSQSSSQIELKAQALEQILPWIAKIQSETARFTWIQNLAALFNINAESLEKKVASHAVTFRDKTESIKNVKRQNPNQNIQKTRFDSKELRLLEIILLRPSLLLKTKASEFVQSDDIRKVILEIEKCFNESNLSSGNANDRPNSDIYLRILDDTNIPEIKQIIAKVIVTTEQEKGNNIVKENEDLLIHEFHDIVLKLKRNSLEARKEKLRVEILNAENSGNQVALEQYVREYHEVVRKLQGEI